MRRYLYGVLVLLVPMWTSAQNNLSGRVNLAQFAAVDHHSNTILQIDGVFETNLSGLGFAVNWHTQPLYGGYSFGVQKKMIFQKVGTVNLVVGAGARSNDFGLGKKVSVLTWFSEIRFREKVSSQCRYPNPFYVYARLDIGKEGIYRYEFYAGKMLTRWYGLEVGALSSAPHGIVNRVRINKNFSVAWTLGIVPDFTMFAPQEDLFSGESVQKSPFVFGTSISARVDFGQW